MSAWLSLHVYVLVGVLDFVNVLLHSGVFEYILVYSGWGEGALCISPKRICVRHENSFGGLRTKLRGACGNFNVPLRRF